MLQASQGVHLASRDLNFMATWFSQVPCHYITPTKLIKQEFSVWYRVDIIFLREQTDHVQSLTCWKGWEYEFIHERTCLRSDTLFSCIDSPKFDFTIFRTFQLFSKSPVCIILHTILSRIATHVCGTLTILPECM